ncbi:uncharacterized protein Dwil_GK15466 [Drosophila willistoni]|uniref:BPTI/Kunitz inhibitor domain-containing protein n=1 Tax=Drosophila willistoni TaxID=7260 RepID=B4MVB9_DROWI|nr:protease inhibitor [Drosophila willistoni]EDW76464.1 uncharacterized protein Dwil_GK15466 [Drosophila willistoni]
MPTIGQMTTQFLILLCSLMLVTMMIIQLPQVQAVTNNAKPVAQVQDARCLQPLDPGPCRMNWERFYYNKDNNICEPFKYGGCHGNENRFNFQQTCEEACLVKK